MVVPNEGKVFQVGEFVKHSFLEEKRFQKPDGKNRCLDEKVGGVRRKIHKIV